MQSMCGGEGGGFGMCGGAEGVAILLPYRLRDAIPTALQQPPVSLAFAAGPRCPQSNTSHSEAVLSRGGLERRASRAWFGSDHRGWG